MPYRTQLSHCQPIRVEVADHLTLGSLLDLGVAPTEAYCQEETFHKCGPCSVGITMNKKFFTAWAVLFVVWLVGSFIVHGVLLGPDYMQLDLFARRRVKAVDGAGRAFWCRCRTADNRADVLDLLRRATDASQCGHQADYP
jgi:hypothetical protein